MMSYTKALSYLLQTKTSQALEADTYTEPDSAFAENAARHGRNATPAEMAGGRVTDVKGPGSLIPRPTPPVKPSPDAPAKPAPKASE